MKRTTKFLCFLLIFSISLLFTMTANAFTEDISAALSAGMNGHIAKPIDTKILYSTLKSAVMRIKGNA